MRALVIGGTEFLGRHVAAELCCADYQVTLFNRGLRGSTGLPVEQIKGDRLGDLAELKGRRWDLVVDTSGYLPRVVRRMAETLRDSVDHYAFISTLSVYESIDRSTNEDSPTATLGADDERIADDIVVPARSVAGGGYGALYGALKARCEVDVAEVMRSRALIVRPGFVVGPYDYSPRFPYWIDRALRGGAVLAPGRPSRPIRLIDARDIARWVVMMGSLRRGGTFNVSGPDQQTMADLVGACSSLNGDLSWTWVDDAALRGAGVRPFEDLPYWLPEDENAILEVRNDAAVNEGLRFRALAETARDTCAWWTSRRSATSVLPGLDEALERRLIAHAQAAW